MQEIHRTRQNLSPNTFIFESIMAPICQRPGARNLPLGATRYDFKTDWLDLNAMLVKLGTQLGWMFGRMSIDSDSHLHFMQNFPLTHQHANQQVESA